jgi:RNA recognition motif-containing protein
MSGHIGEDEIYKIRFFEGKYVLPISVVARVLLRMQRRYYDGDKAYVKNLVQCDPADALPDHFVRLAILHWLEQRQSVLGPAGVPGFHRVETLLRNLTQLGHDANRVRADLAYLIRERCAVAEHQRIDEVHDGDLIKITASGLVHLQLMANPEYLAACAEDTFISDLELAKRVAERIASKGLSGQFSRITAAKNAWELVEYLKLRAEERIGAPEVYLDPSEAVELNTMREAEAAVGATEIEVSKRLYVGNLPSGTTMDELRSAFGAAGLTIAEVVVPPRASGHAARWFGIVEMTDGRNAMEAVDSRDLNLKGRRLVVNEAYPLSSQIGRQQGGRMPSIDITERLYVAGLPYSANETTLRTLFQNHGLNPVDVHIVRDRQSGRGKGFGFVSMSSQSEAAQAIGALNGSLVDGRSLILAPATPRSTDSR